MKLKSSCIPPDRAENICHIASELFARYGFEEVSMRHIAEACGVTMATLYYHFESKEELQVEVAQFKFDEFMDVANRKWAALTEPQRRPSSMIALVYDYILADPTFFLLLQHDLHRFDAGPRHVRSRRQTALILSLLKKSLVSYSSPHDADTDALLLGGLLAGTCELVLADPRTSVPDAELFIHQHRTALIRHVDRAFPVPVIAGAHPLQAHIK